MARTDADIARLVELLGAYVTSVLTARILDETMAGELTPAQLDGLAFIHRHGGCSAKDLSEGLRISIPSSTRLVDRLVRKALVTRHENGADRRLVELRVTPSGEAALDAVHRARLAILRRTLQTLDHDERIALQRGLQRFLHAALHDETTVKVCCRHCGVEHDGRCVVNTAHQAVVGRPIEHP